MVLDTTDAVAASHPALPGHFPGQPIVPGVVLLERVAATARRAFAAEVAGLPQVKFLRPLHPGEDAELRKQTQAENMGWYAGITADMFA